MYYDDDATEEFEPVIEAGAVTEVAAEAPAPQQPERHIDEVKPQVVAAEPQIETEALAGAPGEQSDYDGGTTEDELNEAVGASDYAPKIGGTRHDSSSSTNSGQGTAMSRDRSKMFITTYVTDSFPNNQ